MKVIHLSTYENSGGASVFASELHRQMIELGIDSKLLVLNKKNKNKQVEEYFYNSKIGFIVSELLLKLERMFLKSLGIKTKIYFSLSLIALRQRLSRLGNYDVVHIHWINNGFLSICDLQYIVNNSNKIIVTLHDSWFFTGGCHVAGECKELLNQCNSCPLLESWLGKRVVSSLFKRKKKINENILFVSPSLWMMEIAKKSSALKIENIYNIPNGINLKIFQKQDRGYIRNFLGISSEKILIAFGALNFSSDANKGIEDFEKLIKLIKDKIDGHEFEILIFGSNYKSNFVHDVKINSMGVVEDRALMPFIYSTADVYCSLSKSESFGLTILESIACETPVVAFRHTALPEIVSHLENGYLAIPECLDDFSNGVKYCLLEKVRLKSLSYSVGEENNILNVASEYLQMYE